jgi:hypothetical protein
VKGKEMEILGIDRRIKSNCALKENCYENSEVTEFCCFRVGYSLRESVNSLYAINLGRL